MSFKDKVREVFGGVTTAATPEMDKTQADAAGVFLRQKEAEAMKRAANVDLWPGSILGAAQSQAVYSNIMPNTSNPKTRNNSTTINIQKVANGHLVIMQDNSHGYNGIPWERAWIVPEGQSVTDVIAQAMAVERLTNP